MKTGITLAMVLALLLTSASLCGAQAGTRAKAAEIAGDISSIFADVAGMLGRMADVAKNMTPERRKALAQITQEVAREMVNVSNILVKGIASSDRALELMHVRLLKVQQRIAEIERN